MRNLFAFVGFAVVAFLGLGWYLDWYSLKPVAGDADHQSINVDIHRDKITHDVASGVQKGEEKLQEVIDKKSSEDAGKAADKKTDAAKPKQTSALDRQKMAVPRIIINAEEELAQTGAASKNAP